MPGSFKELELAGWQAKAEAYDGLLATITDQAIGPILESFGGLNHKRLLDVACGTGHLSGTAFNLGAMCEGIDFASTMVQLARTNHPKVKYVEGDAEQLPYENDQFDAVACAFGLLHLEHPEKAISEAWRILKSGGLYSYATWCGPDQGGEYFGLIIGAIKKYGTMEVPLPPVPPAFKYADEGEANKALANAGFRNPHIKKIILKWHPKKTEDILDLLYKSIVRLTLVLEAQGDNIRKKIHEEILEAGKKYRVKEFKFPIVIATAEKKRD